MGVCIESIEVLGTVMSARKNFIYVTPDDKSLLNVDNQILEFDIESNQLKIDKINEIKNKSAYCFKNNKNILEQIIPSIYQLIKTEDFNSITFNEEINRVLINHGITYTDLENSNFKILKSIMEKNIKKIQT